MIDAAGERLRTWCSLLLLVLVVGSGWQCAEGSDSRAELASTSPAVAGSRSETPLRLDVRVLRSFPHDSGASTQGLLWFDGSLYESTGIWGQSSVRQVDLESGAVEKIIHLAPHLFGEGLARVGESLWQLTWRSGLAFRYGLETLEATTERHYRGEGWGLCFDGEDLWRSDGSATLWRHDSETFEATGSIEVRFQGQPVGQLNELECAEGWIYANIWQTEQIVRIDRSSGRVMAVVDASGLLSPSQVQGSGVLNGIAYRPESQTFLLTGKMWPRIFEVVFVEAGP